MEMFICGKSQLLDGYTTNFEVDNTEAYYLICNIESVVLYVPRD